MHESFLKPTNAQNKREDKFWQTNKSRKTKLLFWKWNKAAIVFVRRTLLVNQRPKLGGINEEPNHVKSRKFSWAELDFNLRRCHFFRSFWNLYKWFFFNVKVSADTLAKLFCFDRKKEIFLVMEGIFENMTTK